MLIPYKTIVEAYGLPRGVLHVGAHIGQEAVQYDAMGTKHVIWVEADPHTYNTLKRRVRRYVDHKFYCFAAYDEDALELDFNVTNNGQSSSLLEMGTHLLHHKKIRVTEKKRVKTRRIDSFLIEESIDIRNYNFLNLDIQGVELKALHGMVESLPYIDYVFTEVNKEEVYKECSQICEIDDFLSSFGFVRVATEMTRFQWGDALYIRKR